MLRNNLAPLALAGLAFLAGIYAEESWSEEARKQMLVSACNKRSLWREPQSSDYFAEGSAICEGKIAVNAKGHGYVTFSDEIGSSTLIITTRP